jgi:hypothetical protein
MKHVGTRQRIKKKEGRLEMEKNKELLRNKEGKGGRVRIERGLIIIKEMRGKGK